MPASSLPARLTAPFGVLDRPLNAVNDASARSTPWLAWPLAPPPREETIPGRLSVQILAQTIIANVAAEAFERRTGTLAEGKALRRARARTAVATVVGVTLAAGAWDRRAAELRTRPWRRLAARMTR